MVKIKVAYVTTSYLPQMGGGEIVLHNLLTELIKNYEVEATLYMPYHAYKDILEQGIYNRVGYKIKPLPLNLRKMLELVPVLGKFWAKRFLMNEQKKYKYNLWHANFGYHAGYITSLLKNVSKVLICHGSDILTNKELNYGIRLNKKFNKIIIKTLKNMDKLIAISDTVANEYMAIDSKFKDKIEHIPNGVDSNRFFLSETKEQIRKKLGIPTDKRIILTVGKNQIVKGFKFIPEIIKHLLALRDDFIWIVIGTDAKSVSMFDKDGLTDKYLFLKDRIDYKKDKSKGLIDKINNMPSLELVEYYYASDVFAFTSLQESFGVVLIEAMAAKVPVVTTDAPGCRDVVDDGVNGFKVELGNWKGMAEKINQLLSDSYMYNKISVNSRKIVVEKYDWKIVVEKYFKLYTEMSS